MTHRVAWEMKTMNKLIYFFSIATSIAVLTSGLTFGIHQMGDDDLPVQADSREETEIADDENKWSYDGRGRGRHPQNWTILANSTGEESWSVKKFVLGEDTTIKKLTFSWVSKYQTDSMLFVSMYLFHESMDRNNRFTIQSVYAGEGIDNFYVNGELEGSEYSYEREGSSTEGKAGMLVTWKGYDVKAGTWHVVFITNGPHQMNLEILFLSQVVEEESLAGEEGTFAFQAQDFDGDFQVGADAGNLNYLATVELTFSNTMVGGFWAQDDWTQTGMTRLSFTSPEGKIGSRTILSAQRHRVYDDGEFIDPLIGNAGQWEFKIEAEVQSNDVFLCGVTIPWDYF